MSYYERCVGHIQFIFIEVVHANWYKTSLDVQIYDYKSNKMKNYSILKTHCSKIFLLGSGNFWFEDNTIGDDKSLFYKVFSSLLFLLYGFMTVLEIMAAVMGHFPEDEQRDSVTFAVSHTIVLIKTYSVISSKERIKELNKRMIEICEQYEEEKLMAAKYKSIKINVIAYFSIVYGSFMCFVVEGLRKLYEGTHFVTVVTYYPTYEDNSIAAGIFRLACTLIFTVMMLNMIVSIDSFTMVHLIMYKYKFITLRCYFEKLKEDFDKLERSGHVKEAAEKLTRGLIDGINMHSELLKLSNEIDKGFGMVVALQVCLSSGTAVSLLLQFVLSDQLTFVAGMKIIFFVLALFFLLGLFLCNTGEITYQASLLSDAIFYCGWHACSSRVGHTNVRKIVQLAIMRAQKPLVMKAFKMLELTYATFILVVRSTYSVFALFYAQNK